MIRINQIKIPISSNTASVKAAAADILGIREKDIFDIKILRRSIEARKKEPLSYVYSIAVSLENEGRIYHSFTKDRRRAKHFRNVIYPYRETLYSFPIITDVPPENRPVIIGSGPAGLFCAYELAKAGFAPLVLERGAPVDERCRKVDLFWKEGTLDPETNAAFGEGGAGTFSDGKLNGGKENRYGRCAEVLRVFHENGAPAEILYDSMPHIGTDILRNVIKNLRNKVISLGGEFRFNTKAVKLITKGSHVNGLITSKGETVYSDRIVIAPGHSARDTFEMLFAAGVRMEPKPFAVGLRIIHPQETINVSQWGRDYPEALGSAYYKLTYKAKSGRSVYSFCMCPGGYVINASSEPGRLAINGMSFSDRASGYANAAIVAAVSPSDYSDDKAGIFAGLDFQRRIEERSYSAAPGMIPVCTYGDLITNSKNNLRTVLPDAFKGRAGLCGIKNILPENILADIAEAIEYFGTLIDGFSDPEALLCAVESRTSSPVRIIRDENFQCSTAGLYPCGEGAGYAGGIMSAAVDGIKTAEMLAKNMKNMLR